jgi:hypothetical protein
VIDVSCIYGLPGQRRTILPEPTAAAAVASEGPSEGTASSVDGNGAVVTKDEGSSAGVAEGGEGAAAVTVAAASGEGSEASGNAGTGAAALPGSSKGSDGPATDAGQPSAPAFAGGVAEPLAQLGVVEGAAAAEGVSKGQAAGATGWAYDHKSSSVIKLSNGMVLYLREVSQWGSETPKE